MIILYHIIACTLALIMDRIIGDPPKMPHPIRWLGKFIHFMTKKLNNGKLIFAKGMILTMLTVGMTGVIVFAISYISYEIHWSLYILIQTILMAIGLAQKSLKEAALDVYNPLVSGNIKEARVKLSWIVGRDTANLDESEITRGVVETVSENTSDGVTAPLFYGFLFGATGLWMYKAINTLDSMVGYKNERFMRFGTCSARFDDVVNFIPSRITGFLILTLTPNTYKQSYRIRLHTWLQDAKKHPSPNSGYLEAASAIQMGIQLGGLNYYDGVASHRAKMGSPSIILQSTHIQQVIHQMHRAVWFFWLLFSLIGGVIYYVA